jgi:hypothetical protein
MHTAAKSTICTQVLVEKITFEGFQHLTMIDHLTMLSHRNSRVQRDNEQLH